MAVVRKAVMAGSGAKRGGMGADATRKAEKRWPPRPLFVQWTNEAKEALGSVTLKVVAERLGITRMTLRGYRKPNRDMPSEAVLMRLGEILGRDHSVLLGAVRYKPGQHHTKPKKVKAKGAARKTSAAKKWTKSSAGKTGRKTAKKTVVKPIKKPVRKSAGPWRKRRLFVKWTDEARRTLTPQELALRLGVSVMKLRNWRTGANPSRPPVEVLEALGKLMGRDHMELFN